MFYSLAKRMCLVLSKTRLDRLENSKWGSRQNDIKSFKDRQSWLLQEVGKPAQAHEFDEFSNFISQGSFNITVSGQRAFYRGSKLMNTRATMADSNLSPQALACIWEEYLNLKIINFLRIFPRISNLAHLPMRRKNFKRISFVTIQKVSQISPGVCGGGIRISRIT